ncbi:cobalt-precorrin 5A hydrolase [Natranaerofaba carboxydovora]|uniref:cobalt-precorrin 5A hydrolase n=1 Tax=Natranaerofaba carboxydovora TaxID=2742683 RepID=UPI001F13B30A|nr:cobalamin biosynthesis protein [Natranaerofaba carboxydovora]UMZ73136.1 Cobalt-precorrin-5A hydrolase [Natranaerofaba carboxydovora]
MNYRQLGPAIFAPGKQAFEIAKKIHNVFPKSSLFFSLDKALELAFKSYRQIIIVGAMGIAIRKVAPFLVDKYNDPAVVVVDTEGKFAISMISGHLGGANILTEKIARTLGATPVITTTSDLKGLLTPDYLASRWNLTPEYYNNNRKVLLDINSKIIKGEKIIWKIDSPFKEELEKESELYSDFTLETLLSEDIADYKNTDNTKENIPKNIPEVVLSDKINPAHPYTLCLRPKSVVAGIGCRKGSSFEEILEHLDNVLNKVNISSKSLRAIASVKQKRCEFGLIKAARYLNLPLFFYEPDELTDYQTEYTNSKFVNKIIGVGGVCEPAAKKAAQKKGTVIMKKTISKSRNVTTALARVPWPLWALDPEESTH